MGLLGQVSSSGQGLYLVELYSSNLPTPLRGLLTTPWLVTQNDFGTVWMVGQSEGNLAQSKGTRASKSPRRQGLNAYRVSSANDAIDKTPINLK